MKAHGIYGHTASSHNNIIAQKGEEVKNGKGEKKFDKGRLDVKRLNLGKKKKRFPASNYWAIFEEFFKALV